LFVATNTAKDVRQLARQMARVDDRRAASHFFYYDEDGSSKDGREKASFELRPSAYDLPLPTTPAKAWRDRESRRVSTATTDGGMVAQQHEARALAAWRAHAQDRAPHPVPEKNKEREIEERQRRSREQLEREFSHRDKGGRSR